MAYEDHVNLPLERIPSSATATTSARGAYLARHRLPVQLAG